MFDSALEHARHAQKTPVDSLKPVWPIIEEDCT